MTLRPLLPVAVLLAVLVPTLVLCLVLAVRRRGRVRLVWVVRAAAVLAVTAIGLGPSVPTARATEAGVAVDVFFVVDRTGSMAAEDWADGLPRLEGVRHDVPALVAAVPGARYSIISWDSEATRQLPLTTDARAVTSWAQTARQEITAFSTGSAVDRPLEALTRALEGSVERDPSHVRLVFLLSDGERTTPGETASFAELADLVDGGAVLGYGTSEGGPMRSYDGSLDPDPDAPYIVDDSTGERALSRIDEEELRAVAEQLGVGYTLRTGPDPVEALVEDLDAEQIAADGRRELSTWSAVTWPAAVLLVLLLALEVGTTVHDWTVSRRRRGVRAEAPAPAAVGGTR